MCVATRERENDVNTNQWVCMRDSQERNLGSLHTTECIYLSKVE